MTVSPISIQVDAKSKKWLKDLERQLGPTTFVRTMVPFMDQHAKLAAGSISKNMLSGQRLKRRSGTLARSVVGFGFAGPGRVPMLRVGVLRASAPYAGVQERGGTIKPKRAKALAIPMEAAKTPAGVDKFGGPRGYKGKLSFVPFRGSGVAIGGLFIPESLKSAASLADATMLYMLVREVKIKPKWYMRDGFAEYLPQLVDDLGPFLKSLIVDPNKKGGRRGR